MKSIKWQLERSYHRIVKRREPRLAPGEGFLKWPIIRTPVDKQVKQRNKENSDTIESEPVGRTLRTKEISIKAQWGRWVVAKDDRATHFAELCKPWWPGFGCDAKVRASSAGVKRWRGDMVISIVLSTKKRLKRSDQLIPEPKYLWEWLITYYIIVDLLINIWYLKDSLNGWKYATLSLHIKNWTWGTWVA